MTSALDSTADEATPVASTELVGARAWPIAIWAAMVGWTVVLCTIVHGAFSSFRVGRFDFGNMVQAVWSTTQGRPL